MMLTFEQGDLADMCAASANFLLNRIALRAGLKPDFLGEDVAAKLFVFLERQPDARAEVLYAIARRSGYQRPAAGFSFEPLQVRLAFEVYGGCYRAMRPLFDAHEAAQREIATERAKAKARAMLPPPRRRVLERGPRFGAMRLGMERIGKRLAVVRRRLAAKPSPPPKKKPPRGPGGKFTKQK